MRAACGSDNASFLADDGTLHVALNGASHTPLRADELAHPGRAQRVERAGRGRRRPRARRDDEAVAADLRSFTPLEHRIEPCGTVAGRGLLQRFQSHERRCDAHGARRLPRRRTPSCCSAATTRAPTWPRSSRPRRATPAPSSASARRAALRGFAEADSRPRRDAPAVDLRRAPQPAHLDTTALDGGACGRGGGRRRAAVAGVRVVRRVRLVRGARPVRSSRSWPHASARVEAKGIHGCRSATWRGTCPHHGPRSSSAVRAGAHAARLRHDLLHFGGQSRWRPRRRCGGAVDPMADTLNQIKFAVVGVLWSCWQCGNSSPIPFGAATRCGSSGLSRSCCS